MLQNNNFNVIGLMLNRELLFVELQHASFSKNIHVSFIIEIFSIM